jgi:hypothetical protein
MTVQQIREHFQWLVDDDTLDEDRELVLMNVAYDELHTERMWQFLSTSQETLTIASGDTTYALPTDFMYTKKIVLFDGSETYQEFKAVPFRNRLAYKNVSGYYYIDLKTELINFLSVDDMTTYTGWTLIHEYQYQPAQLAIAADEPVFNRAFHPILAYQMAKQYFYNDQGEKSRAWNNEFGGEYMAIKAKMIRWDSTLDYGTNDHFNPVGAFDGIE